jgi:uncharacterized protein YfkK (UPF0435 family)
MEVLNCLKDITTFKESKDILKELGLKVKEFQNENLYLVKYVKSKSNMSNSDVQKCRGIVIDKTNNKLVCYPPNKSIDIDIFTTKYDWKDIIIEEFIDGTMINVFNYNDDWIVSTRGSIGANSKWYSKKTFSELFSESNTINYEHFNKNYFYTFVLQHPENIIVTKHTNPCVTLVSVGTIENNEYKNIELETLSNHFNIPKRFTFENLTELKNSLDSKDFEFQGYVLKNKSTNERSKVRNNKYNNAKLLKGNSNNFRYVYFGLLQNNCVYDYLEFFPEHETEFESYKNNFIALVKDTLNYYRKYHIEKEIKNIKDIPFRLRPLCYEIHGCYIKNRVYINYEMVYNYILNLPIARIVFSCDYKE